MALTWHLVFERLEFSRNGRQIVRPVMISCGFKTSGFSSITSAFRLRTLLTVEMPYFPTFQNCIV